jgi:hypothetical protein
LVHAIVFACKRYGHGVSLTLSQNMIAKYG